MLLYSDLPSETAHALSSYGASTFGTMCTGPGCSSLTTRADADGVAVGGFSVKRRFSRSHAPSAKSKSAQSAERGAPRCAACSLRSKSEHIQHPPFRRLLRQILHGVDEAERCTGVARVETTGDDATRPTADAGEDSDVLLAVRATIRHRLTDDAGACFELP